jgi:hypothetical protein
LRQGRGGSGASLFQIDLVQKMTVLSVTGLKLSALALVVSTGYILYAVYGGFLQDPPDPARVMENLRIMGQIMAIAGTIGTICLVIVTYEEVAVAVVAGFVGLGYVLGFPLVVASQVGQGGQGAASAITYWAGMTGQAMVAIVGVRVLIEIVQYFREAPLRRAKLAEAEGLEKPKKVSTRPAHRLSRCWEMPYCHDAIKEMCPAFKNRKNCWRIKQGCNCDPYLIESLLRKGIGTNVLSEKGSEYVRTDLLGGRDAGKERTRDCRNCPIFNEHQRQKFHVLNPLIVAGTIVLLGIAYPIMRGLYVQFINILAGLARQFALGTNVPVDDWIQRFDTPAVWIFFYVIVGLILLSYILKLVEWAILVRKVF